MQLPVHLLHAGRGARLAPEGRDPHVRGAHAAAVDLRRARGPVDQGHRRRAAPCAPTCPTLVRMFREVGPELDISLTTNGVLLDTLAAPLAEAGVDRATVSCDSLLRHRFEEMTRRDALEKVLRGAAGRRGRRPHPDQDQLRRDRRHERRRGRRTSRAGRGRPATRCGSSSTCRSTPQHAWERAKVVPAARILRDDRRGVSRSSPTAHGAEPATSYRFADGAPGGIGVIAERHRAVLRHVQPPAADGGGAGARLPVRARGDRPARPDARRAPPTTSSRR